MDILPGAPASQQWSSYREPSFYTDIRVIQEENAKLLQSKQPFQSTRKELHEARQEMKELIDVVHSLREDMERSTNSASSHSSYRPLRASAAKFQPKFIMLQPEEEDEEDWHDPLPWPASKDDRPTGMRGLNLGQQDTHQNQPPHSSPTPSSMFTSQPHQFMLPAPHNGTMPYPPAQPPQPLSHPAPAYTGSRPPVLPQAAPFPTAMGATPSSLPPNHPVPAPVSELVYRGPKPTIPKFTHTRPQ